MRRLAGLGVAAGVALLATLWSAAPASAHNSLVGSAPKDGAQVDAGPAAIQLTFDEPVQFGQGLNTVAVVGPNNDQWEAGPPEVASNVVTAPVRPLGPVGAYKVRWRVLSADGHPVSGELTFTLTKAGTGTPAPPGQQSAAPNSAGGTGGGIPAWIWIAGAAVVLVAGLVLALRVGGKGES